MCLPGVGYAGVDKGYDHDEGLVTRKRQGHVTT